MACFIAPVVEAIIVSAVKKRMEKQETLRQALLIGRETPEAQDPLRSGSDPGKSSALDSYRQPAKKLGWLSNMLWGGSFLLLFEHIWHGEIVPWPPFITAMNDPAETLVMLSEIATVGVSMAVLITAVWGVMVLITSRLEKKSKKTVAAAQVTEG